MIAFKTEESFSQKGRFKPTITFEACEYINCCLNGTYHTVAARLFGLSYAEFMRMVRDKYNAELVGRSGGYIYYTFKEKVDCDKLTKELNKRWNELTKR